MKVMAGSHGIISNKLNKNHSKSPRKWNSAFTSSIPNCTQNRGQMVTGVLMKYQAKTMRQPPTHTHFFRDLYHESHPECCYGLIVSIQMESTKVPFAHTSPPQNGSHLMTFGWFQCDFFSCWSIPELSRLWHSSHHWPLPPTLSGAAGNLNYQMWRGWMFIFKNRDILLKRHKTSTSEDSGVSFGYTVTTYNFQPDDPNHLSPFQEDFPSGLMIVTQHWPTTN